MADQKLTQLTEETSPSNDDLVYHVDDPSGTPTSKKMTWTTIKSFLKTYFDSLYIAVLGSSTDNAVVRMDGTGGGTIQETGVIIDDSDNVSGVTTLTVDSDIIHTGDTDTKLAFTTNTIALETGGVQRFDVNNSGMRLGGANSRVTTILDEDDMNSDSATALATQQSIKKYVDDIKRSIGIQVTDGSSAIETGDGKAYFRVPAILDGYELVDVEASVTAPSTSGTVDIQIARGRQSGATSAHSFVDMLSTVLTIDANEYDSKDASTAHVINTSNDDLGEGDLLRVDLDSIGSGPSAVLSVNLTFQKP